MTILKKLKGKSFHKNGKKTTSKPRAKKSTMVKDHPLMTKNWPKNVKIVFEDEFLNNALQVHNILE
ncbi:hypothetical protein [Flavobacterium sp. 102]|uniref:hypothetical protein n=1 Tax=Flavobacterium sp. 102 TaxID=2135623 RepID=UPI000EAE0913|nr:hypothetical protein [Flavobacterium sp. 102]RKS03601.1 hypothetical protein C8C84_3362 [Flavobacterium sp. 102]